MLNPSEQIRSEETLEAKLAEITSVAREPDENFLSKTDELIKQRLEMLKDTDQIPEVKGSVEPVSGFIPSKTKLYRNILAEPFMLTDDSIYRDFINNLRTDLGKPENSQMTARERALFAVQDTIDRYFGNRGHTKAQEMANQDLYDRAKEPIRMEDLRGKGIAVCLEKAAVAQNLLTFAGYDSKLAMGEVSKGERFIGHSFNLVKGEKGYSLYDPSNPRFIYQGDDQMMEGCYPFLSRIGTSFMPKEFFAEHTDVKYAKEGASLINPVRITYRTRS